MIWASSIALQRMGWLEKCKTNENLKTQDNSLSHRCTHTTLDGEVISEASNLKASEAAARREMFGSGKLH